MPATTSYRPTFVSHAHADNELCDRYVAALRQHGVDIWYDRTNMQDGHMLNAEIESQLRQRTAFVLLATPSSLASYWVRLEVGAFQSLAAQDASRLFLPVRIAACEMPLLMMGIKWIDALTQPFDATISAIAAALAQPAAVPASVTPAAPLSPPLPTLPPLGPAPAPANATPAHHLTPMSLYNLGFRGWNVNGVECVLPPICPVPGGVFIMGSDTTHDKEAFESETPQYPVHVDSFSIGQHPVTVAEYACAVRAKAVREPPKWEYKEWKMDWQTQLAHLDHPVVCVSWQNAVAYIRWLAHTTGQPWRLPTEAEWEKMARWDTRAGQSRIYPWGDTFDKVRCNTSESGTSATTPVGRYPSGASPYGAQDVAGNVWEWTSSLYKPYAYSHSDGREDQKSTGSRVLRGGSWYNGRRYARAAYRLLIDPVLVYGDFGFRVVLAAPGS